jgi:hypothetical protein
MHKTNGRQQEIASLLKHQTILQHAFVERSIPFGTTTAGQEADTSKPVDARKENRPRFGWMPLVVKRSR